MKNLLFIEQQQQQNKMKEKIARQSRDETQRERKRMNERKWSLKPMWN